MRLSKMVRLALGCAVLGALLLPVAASGQAPSTAMAVRFAGSATTNPSLGLLGVPEAVVQTPGPPWVFSFVNDPGSCQAAGQAAGAPAAGSCNLSASGDLQPDIEPLDEGRPRCGNSRGQSTAASFDDPNGTHWVGEVHWDGVGVGDPSYSLGSQLLLFGSMDSDKGHVQVIQLLNATGSPQCNPLTNANWPNESKFVVNGVMLVLS
jgi:hypothetical protein